VTGVQTCALPISVIFDGRNIYDAKKMKERGFLYHSIGRRAVESHV
jgi:hypothetical protein